VLVRSRRVSRPHQKDKEQSKGLCLSNNTKMYACMNVFIYAYVCMYDVGIYVVCVCVCDYASGVCKWGRCVCV